jgi:uncharacterized protein (TIGR03000 family)
MRHFSKGLMAALALPLAAVTAQAQHGGHGGGGGHAAAHSGGSYHGGSYGGYHGHPGSYGSHNFYGVNVSPYGVGFNYLYRGSNGAVGVSLGYPFYGYGGYGYGGYGYGGYGSRYYGGYPYGLSSWSFASPYAYPVVYSAPATAALVGSAIPVVPSDSAPPADPAQAAPANPNTAYVEVRVPADAQVWLGPTPSDQTGPVRTFVSPPLEAGYDYSYVVRARWVQNGLPVTRERKVPVHPGDRVSIDLNRPQ